VKTAKGLAAISLDASPYYILPYRPNQSCKMVENIPAFENDANDCSGD
jgi:hypothetical protein